jgi:hypothetical protein
MEGSSPSMPPSSPSSSISTNSGPAAWLARSIAAQTSPKRTSTASSPLAKTYSTNVLQKSSHESKSEDNSMASSAQPNLKFLNRRKKTNGVETGNNTINTDAGETELNASMMTAFTNLSTNPVANAKTLATTSEKLHKLTIEMHKLKEERDMLIQDKQIWLKKVKDDNLRLTLMLQVGFFAWSSDHFSVVV